MTGQQLYEMAQAGKPWDDAPDSTKIVFHVAAALGAGESLASSMNGLRGETGTRALERAVQYAREPRPKNGRMVR